VPVSAPFVLKKRVFPLRKQPGGEPVYEPEYDLTKTTPRAVAAASQSALVLMASVQVPNVVFSVEPSLNCPAGHHPGHVPLQRHLSVSLHAVAPLAALR
jgi:hypothetical protein